MWIYTTEGFISIIDESGKGDPVNQGIHIKSRDRGILDWIAAHIPLLRIIKVDEDEDYQWQIIIRQKEVFAEVMGLLLNTVTYSNFKAAANKDAYPPRVLFDVYDATNRTMDGQTKLFGTHQESGIDLEKIKERDNASRPSL